jgi:hypothetical protein
MKISVFWDMTPCSPMKSNRPSSTCSPDHADFLLDSLFDLDDGGDISFRNVGYLSQCYTVLYPKLNFDVFYVLTAMNMNTIIFQDVTPCNLVELYGCFGGTYCLHLQGLRVSQSSSKLYGIRSKKRVFIKHITELLLPPPSEC